MAGSSFLERTKVARLGLARQRSRLLAVALGSPLLRWRYGAPVGEELVLVPQELRSADPSVLTEIEQGELVLGGWIGRLDGRSPFALSPPSQAWARELHGFGWLRHLRAVGTPEARQTARAWVGDWVQRRAWRAAPASAPEVTGRRLVSWLVNADLLLDGADRPTFDRTLQALADQLVHLASHWRCAPEGHPRLVALTGLVYADLCVAGHDRHLADAETLLASELARQILPDGGHVSRDAGVIVELLLDLLPLRQCYATRERPLPAGIAAAIERMVPMLRFMQLGDGSLARFNGTGTTSADDLAAVLAYEVSDAGARHVVATPFSRYARLEAGDLKLIADVGAPPPLALAGRAHAGCLSFELSAGYRALILNAGAPAAPEATRLAAARGTASHNTLVLGDRSSARLVEGVSAQGLAGGQPITMPAVPEPEAGRSATEAFVEAAHHGYLATFGLVHRRRLSLDSGGLGGVDRLAGPNGPVRLPRDVPFAIHFHLAPQVETGTATPSSLELWLRGEPRWRFTAEGAELSLEPSVHYADAAGPLSTRQIVLRGASPGETEVRWRLERLGG